LATVTGEWRYSPNIFNFGPIWKWSAFCTCKFTLRRK
jgi:hypothetical protein